MPKIDITSLSAEELHELRENAAIELENHQKRKKEDARKDVLEMAKSHGFSLEELFDIKGSKKSKTKRPIKYRHPEKPSLTWTGAGRQPNWIKEALEQNNGGLSKFAA